jgi:hypothetical protein
VEYFKKNLLRSREKAVVIKTDDFLPPVDRKVWQHILRTKWGKDKKKSFSKYYEHRIKEVFDGKNNLHFSRDGTFPACSNFPRSSWPPSFGGLHLDDELLS